MLACASCWNWNGGTLNTVLMLPEPVSSAMVESAGDDVGGAGQQRLVHRRRTVEALPGNLEILQAALPGIFFDQPVALHDIELQVAHRELLGEPDLGGFG